MRGIEPLEPDEHGRYMLPLPPPGPDREMMLNAIQQAEEYLDSWEDRPSETTRIGPPPLRPWPGQVVRLVVKSTAEDPGREVRGVVGIDGTITLEVLHSPPVASVNFTDRPDPAYVAKVGAAARAALAGQPPVVIGEFDWRADPAP